MKKRRTFRVRRHRSSYRVMEERKVVGRIDLVRTGADAGKHRAEVLGQTATAWSMDRALELACMRVDQMAIVLTNPEGEKR